MEDEKESSTPIVELLSQLKTKLDFLENRVAYLEKITQGLVVYGTPEKFWGK